MNRQKDDFKSLLLLLGSMAIFGGIGLVRRLIPLPSSVIAMVRGLIGGTATFLYFRARGGKLSLRALGSEGPWLLLSGALLGFNWILLFEAYRYTSVAVATLCYYMAPILIVLVSPILFRERITAKKAICVAVALGGMMLVSGVLKDGGVKDVRGVLFGLAAAVLYASIVLTNKKLTRTDGLSRTILQLLTAGVVLLPYVLITENVTALDWSGSTIPMLLVAGLIFTALTYAMYFSAIPGLRAQTAALGSYVDPVVAVLVSAIFLHEPMSAAEWIGAVLILSATAISTLD
ncbi:MAG: DMT family transporter [Oscillospiraceae bacterium]|nr:DMT family transporter [Oscillospiraceae bacterium]